MTFTAVTAITSQTAAYAKPPAKPAGLCRAVVERAVEQQDGREQDNGRGDWRL
ncbi:hypothetical protein [Bradyrhizobium sp. Tv2a-2]|uniref:hypothetical protein n=1 Tax=Bradyrhizobium sp. Tv2a-2 TaxID=113395 RepID=UPI0004121300|nr:hypothetical protein [Bradyrhizobium sp. Tv2a-2]